MPRRLGRGAVAQGPAAAHARGSALDEFCWKSNMEMVQTTMFMGKTQENTGTSTKIMWVICQLSMFDL